MLVDVALDERALGAQPQATFADVVEGTAPAEVGWAVFACVAVVAVFAPLSVRAGKAMVYAVAEHGRSRAFEVAEEIWEPVYLSDDAQEGPRAFSERRRPQWSGR